MVHQLLEALFLPPAAVLLMVPLGALLARRWKRLGRTLCVLALLWLWALSTPFVANLLLRSLQTFPALPPTGALPEADAIVVLSAEADPVGAEFGGPVAGPMTMQRLRYAAALQKRTGLPLLVSGGVAGRELPSLASVMAKAATTEFGVPVRWQEDRSADTRENALFSAAILKAAGMQRVMLVTSAWHMPRAAAAFEAAGLRVIAAPTGFAPPIAEDVVKFTPHWRALRDADLALHEWVGRLVYAITG
jgi:uncharacterized SAM-binding protein YcdF (DUF218 family)